MSDMTRQSVKSANAPAAARPAPAPARSLQRPARELKPPVSSRTPSGSRAESAPPPVAPGAGHDFGQVSVNPPKAHHRGAREGGKATEKAPPEVSEAARSGGQPLDTRTRGFMESRFGHDFSQVRVHTDARASEAARSVSARAYTLGSDVVFRAGQYQPETGEGRKTLAHELAHVVQQGGAGTGARGGGEGPSLSRPQDRTERDATRAADAVARGARFVPPPEPSARGREAVVHRLEEDGSKASPSKPGPSNTPGVGTGLDARIPFKAKESGAPGGWDSGAILKESKINSDSVVGQAIAAGPDALLPVIKSVKEKADAFEAQAGQGTSFDAWVAARFAALDVRRAGFGIILQEVTYADLMNLAAVEEIMSLPRLSEKVARLISWFRAASAGNVVEAYAARKTPPPTEWGKQYKPPPPPNKKAPPGKAVEKTKFDSGKEAEDLYQDFKGDITDIEETTAGGVKRTSQKSDFLPKGGGTPAAEFTFEMLKEVFPNMAADAAKDPAKNEKAWNYFARVKQAFDVMKINTVQAQAVYLTHATEEADQFRQFTETQGSPAVQGGKQKWVDDYKNIELDETYLKGQYKKGGSVNPHGEYEFIGRGPVQVTHREGYIEVLAMLDKMAEDYEKKADAGDLKAGEKALFIREATNAIKGDPREAANPKYTFLVSAAMMKVKRGDVKVAFSRPGKAWTPSGTEAGWVAGGEVPADSPQEKALARKTTAYGRIFPILDREAKKASEAKKKTAQ